MLCKKTINLLVLLAHAQENDVGEMERELSGSFFAGLDSAACDWPMLFEWGTVGIKIPALPALILPTPESPVFPASSLLLAFVQWPLSTSPRTFSLLEHQYCLKALSSTQYGR